MDPKEEQHERSEFLALFQIKRKEKGQISSLCNSQFSLPPNLIIHINQYPDHFSLVLSLFISVSNTKVKKQRKLKLKLC